MTLEGGCQCGQVRYRIAGDRPAVYACHCRECQKQSASAFGLSIPIRETRLEITGELKSWTRDADSGGRTECFFCPRCGSRVYHRPSGDSGMITIKGGSADDPSWFEPTAHIWVSRSQPWVVFGDDVKTFDKQPETQQEWAILFGVGEPG